MDGYHFYQSEPLLKKEPIITVSAAWPETPLYHRLYNRGATTRQVCLVGLFMTAAIAAAGFTVAVYQLSTNGYASSILSTPNVPVWLASVVVPLLLALVVTCCNECMGYIHTVTLRWALWHEGRLKFNTNLRLLANARTSPPNTYVPNGIYLLLTAVSYTAVSQMFTVSTFDSDPTAMVSIGFNVVALFALSASWMANATFCTWGLVMMRGKMLTWSSNPLNMALAATHDGLARSPGQSMVPYRKFKSSTNLLEAPLPRQRSLFKVRSSARWVLIYIWIVLVISIAWTALFTGLTATPFNQTLRKRENVLHGGIWTAFDGFGHRDGSGEIEGPLGSPGAQRALSLAVVCAIQLYLTFGLHCAELLVNATRDEQSWRAAARSQKGAQPDQGALKAAFGSWETLTLGTFKVLMHWAYGQAIVVSEAEMAIFSRALFLLSGLCFLLALFGTYLACRRPSGPQPAAYGHVQTLINLVDDWGSYRQPIFWGDKGLESPYSASLVRRAGTSSRKEMVGKIRPNALYK